MIRLLRQLGAAAFLVQVPFLLGLCNCDGVGGATAGKGLPPDDGSPLLLLISFDGFRWDYLNRGRTPTFGAFASEGGRAEYITNAFVTKTFPNHYTLVTGLYEESHGLIANSMYDPELNATFSLGNVAPEWWSRDGQEPVWITNQRHGGSSANVDYPGMDVAFDGIRPDYELTHYDENMSFDERSDIVAELFGNGSVNFAALYFHEPDHTGHLSGPESAELDDILEMCDDTMLYLIGRLNAAGVYDSVNIIVTSDHGMTSVSPDKTVFAEDYLDGGRFPYFTTENNPVLGIWPNNSAHVDSLYQSFKAAPHITVYKKEDIPPEYHYSNNVRVPPIIAVADTGWMVVGSRDGGGTFSFLKGDHGYSNTLKSMYPFFMVHGPAFKSGGQCPPFRSVDVYPLMCQILGIPPRPNNGTMRTVRQLLKDDDGPTSDEPPPPQGHNQFFSVGIAFACIIAMLSVVLVVGMCLRQRTYRTTETLYNPVNGADLSLKDDLFEDPDQSVPDTII